MANIIINNWQTKAGNKKDVVLSSRIRIARNLNNYKFPNQCNENEKKEIIEYIKKELSFLLKDNYIFYLMEKMDDIERKILHEQYLISSDLAYKPDSKALFLNNDNNISIMINEEDHLRIQTLKSGLEFDQLWEKIDGLDDQIDQRIDYAFSNKWGYLTSCPTNIGTAMRASGMCHLPALVLSGRIDNILGAVGKFGLTVRGLSGEGSSSKGDIYQISNQLTLGNSEKEIIDKLNGVIEQIIAEERKSREFLLRNNYLKLKDNVLRSLGILKYAYQLEENEALKYLSRIKFGLDTNLIDGEIDSEIFSELLFDIRNAHLQLDNKLNEDELNIKRAELIRNKLNGE